MGKGVLYIKTKIRIITLCLIGIGIIVAILFICGFLIRKYPKQKEINNMLLKNRKSFEAANEYLLNLEPDENGIVNYNLKTLESNKASMTEREYKALKTVFSNSLIDNYNRRDSDTTFYGEYGRFKLKSNYKGVTIFVCKIPDEQEKRDCTNIVNDWYVYDYYHS